MYIYDGRNDKKESRSDRTAFVVSAGQIVGEHDYMTVRMQGRGDYSLFFCKRGKIFYDTEQIAAGEYIVVPPNAPQKYAVYQKDETVYSYLHFTGGDLQGVFSSLGIELCKIQKAPTGMEELLKKIRSELKEGGAVSELKAEAALLRLLALCAEKTGNGRVTRKEQIARIVEEMEHSYFLPYDDGKFARLAFVSQSRFHHVFKEQTGVSPQQYYIGVRMENARRLLEYTDMKIKEVSLSVGYEDALYFGRAFKKAFGVTPKEYKKGRVKS